MKNFLHLSRMAGRGSLLFLFLTLFSTNLLHGQANGDFRSKNWATAADWEIYNSGTSTWGTASASVANGVTKGSVKIYPTLVSDILMVETTDIETAMIQIMDVTGRVVLAQPLNSSVFVGSLPNGVYMAVFTSDNGVTTTKFVKQ
jgi:Secretion system C-terminal sorting domain